MPLTVLSDFDVNKILHSYNKEDIEALQETLADALHWYSTSNDANDACSDYQPERTHLKRKDGSTTLFMPASGLTGQGIKVVNIVPPDATGLPAFKDDASLGSGLINAEEVTAFRTALAATMLLKKRHSVHTITIFGAGKQAYWHARLALLLRGPECHHLNIITRNFSTAQQMIQRLYNPQPEDPDYVNHIGPGYNSKTKKEILTPSHTEYHRLLKQYVRQSEVIFTTTPSTTPLFPATYLTNPSGRTKGRYISCIGSYTPSMVEIHPDILRYAVAPHHEHRHIHKRQKEGGAIIVDTVSGCLKEAGEVIQAGLKPDQVVELGELFMLKRDAEKRMKEKGEKTTEGGCNLQENAGLREWLTRGNVIYKSVGLGLMDVTVGNALVETARERGVGVTIERF
ncbi:uncharacterized protein MYCGRDRAFT_56546 [Zymoseptoria tritici IPO323]|uniref:NAD(P)-binding protein n=1 Tax=Zymoseptoria tritici (strain CBS 115943 / IPO323) TaxID=336722 RepID=F9X6R4_ZYMTI|nr:uncharacterized protein MYCGRDRAFT_56546 [Zymoseptoria tritici IPO323]EGP88739.1 hypothetical protein MYCGRDRAFT_56546 [Zymoseptoria tritici IPO323]